MKHPSNILSAALFAAAFVSAPAGARAGDPVFAGGTNSIAGEGYHDMAVSSNTTDYRALGGQLYIHPNGWDPTSAADKASVEGLFPSPPILESAISGTDPTSVISYYNTRNLHTPWPTLYAVTVNYLATQTSTVMQQVVNSFSGITSRVAIIVGPNSNGTDATNYPFSSSHWDQLRANALLGHSLATDAPPGYYFAREEAYRVWIAAAITWANSNNLPTIAILFPGNSASGNGFALDCQNYLADLEARGARPTVWAYDNYYGSSGTVAHPMGSEDVIADQNYSALHTVERETGVAALPGTRQEAEWLQLVQKSSATHRLIDATQFSQGVGTILDGTVVGDYMIYNLPNVAAGTYDVRIGVKTANTRGICQVSIGRSDNFTGTATNVGAPQDLYSSADAWVELDLGNWTPGTTSDKWIEFNATGKNAASTAYSMSIDYITLIPQ